MKTKIFICSNSGIDYLPHSSMITSIPVILRFSNEEEYEDYYDVNIDAFYNRVRLDKKANPKVVFQNYAKICKYMEEAKKEGYDEILFLLSSHHFGDLQIPVSIAISEYPEIHSVIYNSNTCCYPLAYMALEASEMILKQSSLDEILVRLEHIKKNHHLMFFNPKVSGDNRFTFAMQRRNGVFYTIENGALFHNERIKKVKPWNQMLQLFLKEINEEDVIPFVLYTYKGSKYIQYIEQELIKRNPNLKKIRTYPIPPAIGIQAGINSVGLGYIVR